MAKLSHVDREGKARMVDVGAKAVTRREAAASAFVKLSPETIGLIRANGLAKGDVLNTSRLAGIQAAKRAHELIPLTHPIPLENIAVDLDVERRVSASAAALRPRPRPAPRWRPDGSGHRRPDDLRYGQGRGAGRGSRPPPPRLQERRQERGLPEKGMTRKAGGSGTIVSVNTSVKRGRSSARSRPSRSGPAGASRATPTRISATGRSRSWPSRISKNRRSGPAEGRASRSARGLRREPDHTGNRPRRACDRRRAPRRGRRPPAGQSDRQRMPYQVRRLPSHGRLHHAGARHLLRSPRRRHGPPWRQR